MRKISFIVVIGMLFSGCSKGVVLSGIFWDIDKDGNHAVDIEEYHYTRKDWLQEQAKREGVSTMKLAQEEFVILDTNNDALLSKQEFFDEVQNEKVYKNRDKNQNMEK